MSRYYSLVAGVWQGVQMKVCFINVYGPQSGSKKEELWDDLNRILSDDNVVWILFGDFNAVRLRDEKAGSVFKNREANVFNDFIAKGGLFDFHMGSRRFTRFSKDGLKMSKIDRFLVSSNFFEVWKDASVTALCRVILDHFPVSSYFRPLSD